MDVVTEPAVQNELERELRLVGSAITMVRRGVATRVTVVNLPLCGSRPRDRPGASGGPRPARERDLVDRGRAVHPGGGGGRDRRLTAGIGGRAARAQHRPSAWGCIGRLVL